MGSRSPVHACACARAAPSSFSTVTPSRRGPYARGSYGGGDPTASTLMARRRFFIGRSATTTTVTEEWSRARASPLRGGLMPRGRSGHGEDARRSEGTAPRRRPVRGGGVSTSVHGGSATTDRRCEGAGFLCTVTISKISPSQAWWFSSCTKCHRASVLQGGEYKCSGGCPCKSAEPKYRLCFVGTDGSSSAEFVLFGRVARQVIGKPVASLIRSVVQTHGSFNGEHVREIAAPVSQKFTFSISVTQKSLTQRNVSFQVNVIHTFYGKQTCVPAVSDIKIPDTFDKPTAAPSVSEKEINKIGSASDPNAVDVSEKSPAGVRKKILGISGRACIQQWSEQCSF